MNHKDKIKLARRMISPDEIENKVSIFDSKGWSRRSNAKAKKRK